MASDCIWGPKSLPASADLSAYQFRFMKLDGNGRLALPTLGGHTVGVLQDKPTALGQPGQICRPGDITKVYVASSITAGAFVSADATGQAIPAVSGDYIEGWALEAVTSVSAPPSGNAIARIVYQPMGKM